MTDWRQIQARIRKAKASPDAPAQLVALYETTHDAMVAFELAKHHEKSGATDEAVRWYTAAAQRFRRAQWKTKAEEALTRLGAPIPPPEAAPSSEPPQEVIEFPAAKAAPAEPAQAAPNSSEASAVAPGEAAAGPDGRKRRRRGRRGGRRHRKQPEGTPAPAAAPPRVVERPAPRREPRHEVAAPPPIHHEPIEPPMRGRPGDPGMASRLAHLESQLRRLLAGPLYRLEASNEAPAGPGVFLVTDADQTEYYYVEACKTLRIGIGNLLPTERGGSRRGAPSLRGPLAEHLGISESRVSKYLKDHCVVRWIQIDEGASRLAHFAIAVLHPVLND